MTIKVLELFSGLQILVSSDGRVFSLPHYEKRANGRVENLEWATQKEQKRHSIDNHLCDKNIEALKNANERASRKVNIAGKTYPSVRSASRELGISQWSVARKGVFYG